jgi:hypothetical protein
VSTDLPLTPKHPRKNTTFFQFTSIFWKKCKKTTAQRFMPKFLCVNGTKKNPSKEGFDSS